MRNSLLTRSWLVLLLTLTVGNTGIAEPMPRELLRSFYQSYLQSLGNAAGGNQPALAFSSDFRKAIEENTHVCAEFATGVCGFGADGDIYLDSQEYETGLSLTSSGFRISEDAEGIFTVALNVYPSVATTDGYYEKRVTFRMILENGAWVVDDILYADQVSSKVRMREENEFYRKNPDPDSPHAQRKSAADAR